MAEEVLRQSLRKLLWRLDNFSLKFDIGHWPLWHILRPRGCTPYFPKNWAAALNLEDFGNTIAHWQLHDYSISGPVLFFFYVL